MQSGEEGKCVQYDRKAHRQLRATIYPPHPTTADAAVANGEGRNTTVAAKLEAKKKPHKPGLTPQSTPLIVGIGASAGGLEAFTQFLKALPAHSGMAYVLVQHLDPRHDSMLTALLSRATSLPVVEISDGMVARPDQVYVIPPNCELSILHGVLQLLSCEKAQSIRLPINTFFQDLALDQGNRSIGIILSGTASDGTLGLKAIKEAGGITFAQDEQSAKYFGMPGSAIAAGCVDFVLDPAGMVRELLRVGSHPYVSRVNSIMQDEKPDTQKGMYDKIYLLLRSSRGVDFTHYKQTTLKRRIKRRMLLHKLDRLADYIKYLRSNSGEIAALYQDILISVTGFFREPESYDALTQDVLPAMLKGRSPDEPIRIWVPGCATGEEPYSIAICLLEAMQALKVSMPVQVFATDIDDQALERARTGIYADSLAANISPERLHRFFTKMEGGYQISKSLRDMCVFARQNVIKDPPFSRLDLISCRNLLIYLEAVLQNKVLRIFHYALKPGAFLMLGTSETIGSNADLFALLDKKQKIYKPKLAIGRTSLDFGMYEQVTGSQPAGRSAISSVPAVDLQREAERIIIERFGPPAIVVDGEMQILHFFGQTAPYLVHGAGEASLSLMKMAREGLLFELRAAINDAATGKKPVRKDGLRVRHNGSISHVDVEVIPLRRAAVTEGNCFLILFQQTQEAAGPALQTDPQQPAQEPPVAIGEDHERVVHELQQELTA